MEEWFLMGYFPMKLLVRRGRTEDFVLLGKNHFAQTLGFPIDQCCPPRGSYCSPRVVRPVEWTSIGPPELPKSEQPV